MKGSHLFCLSRSKGMTVDIWIRDYNPPSPRCSQKQISGRGKHNPWGQASKQEIALVILGPRNLRGTPYIRCTDAFEESMMQ
jgi:hypothetical protein